MDWYGVKVLEKITLTGEARPAQNEPVLDFNTFYREKVVLVKADSVRDAWHKTKIKESELAKEHGSFVNRHGQTVTRTYQDIIECAKLSGEPAEYSEVFCTYFVGMDEVSADEIICDRYNSCPGEWIGLMEKND